MTRGFALILAAVVLPTCTPVEPRGFGQAPPPTTRPVTPLTPGAGSPPARSVQVTALPGLRFAPELVQARPGDVISLELRNEDVEDHTLVVSELAVAMLAGGGETVRSIVRVGEGAGGGYVYFCSIADHREAGMEGTIRVR